MLKTNTRAFRVILTNFCNFNCNYCFNEWQTPDRKRIADVSLINKALEPYSNRIKYLKLTGGEPLLHPELNIITDTLEKLAPVTITTNGTYLDKWFKTLSNTLDYTISIYGYDFESFNSYTKCTRNEYDKIISQLNIVKYNSDRFSANILIQPDKLWSYEKILDFCINLGFKKIRFITLLSNNNVLKMSENRKDVEFFFQTLDNFKVISEYPSIKAYEVDGCKLEFITQYSEFSESVIKDFNFYWIDLDGNVIKKNNLELLNF